MKLKNMLLMALPLAVAATSCTRHAGEPARRSLLFNNETNIDSDGYLFLLSVHEKAVSGVKAAEQIQSASAPEATKALASKINSLYGEMIPELEKLAEDFHVLLPDPGLPGFSMPHHFSSDSVSSGIDNESFLAYAQHEQGAILDQFQRVDRNTSKVLKKYAREKLTAVKEIYKLAGVHDAYCSHT